MRTGLFAAAVLAVALAVPADSFARHNGSGPSAGTMRPHTSMHRHTHRHSLRGHHGHHADGRHHAHGHRHLHRHAIRFGLGYLGSYAYPGYVHTRYVYDDAYVSSPYVYGDPQTTYAQNPQEAYKRLTPAGQCWTQSVQVSPDRSRDVRITRC